MGRVGPQRHRKKKKDGRVILKLILRKQDERVWNGLIRLRIGTSDVLL